jgi:hypothetical protein
MYLATREFIKGKLYRVIDSVHVIPRKMFHAQFIVDKLVVTSDLGDFSQGTYNLSFLLGGQFWEVIFMVVHYGLLLTRKFIIHKCLKKKRMFQKIFDPSVDAITNEILLL